MKQRKHSAAAALGRRGGRKRAQNLTAAERSEQSRNAVQARWAKIADFIKKRARAAIERVRARAAGAGGFDWQELKRQRDEGRQ